MRYPAEHKAEMRERIVEEAARAYRENGLDGLGVADLMKRLGLTHGGFYNHFRDREELVAEAVARAAAETARDVFDANADNPSAALSAYLSRTHVESPASGCVLAALGSEGSRHRSRSVRRAFAHAAKGFLELVQRTGGAKARSGRLDDRALVTASQMIGAVVLARLVDDEALSERILTAARRANF